MSPSRLHIGILADTHFWLGTPQPASGQLQDYSELICESLLADMAASPLDLAVHLGDVTCGGSHYGMGPADFDRTLDWFLARMRSLPCPVHILPGNHDMKLGETYRPTEARLGRAPGLGTSITFPAHGLQLELINAQGHSAQDIAGAADGAPVAGKVAAAELTRLAQALQAARDMHVIVGIHQLLQPVSDTMATNEGSFVQNRQEVRDILAAQGNVRAVFQGHDHRYAVHSAPLGDRDCTFVVAPALCLWPPAWLLLTVERTGLTLEIRYLDLGDAYSVAPDRRERPATAPAVIPF